MGESIKQEEAEVESQIASFANAPATPPADGATAPAASVPSDASTPDSSSTTSSGSHSKVIQPLSDMSQASGSANLEELLAKEKIKDEMAKAVAPIINRPMAADPGGGSGPGSESIDPNTIAL